jgi:hypothetical protein
MTVVSDFMKELYNPETLLRHFHVIVAGGSGGAPQNGPAAVRRFTVSDGLITASGFTTGLSGKLGRTKNRPVVKIRIVGGVPFGAPTADQFNAYYIPMVQTADVGNNASHYTLPTNGIPDIAITSQLTACTFGIGSDAMGATLVTHVQPNQNLGQNTGQAGFDLRVNNLATTVDNSFPNMKGKFVFQEDYNHSATVIGKLTNGNWKFYMQANKSGGHGRAVNGLTVI